MKRILVVEDDEFIQTSLKDALEMKNYEIVQAHCAKEALTLLNESIDLIILDIQLPDNNGIVLCQQFRQTYSLPILFLTCQNNEDTIVEALNAGGDDYVCKPFGIKELYARIESLFRRVPIHCDVIYTADLKINTQTYKVYKNNQEIDLSIVTYQILLCLVQNQGIVITRQHLLELIEQLTMHFVEDNTLSVHMKRLRTKLGTYQGQPYIETLRGVGYRWIQ